MTTEEELKSLNSQQDSSNLVKSSSIACEKATADARNGKGAGK